MKLFPPPRSSGGPSPVPTFALARMVHAALVLGPMLFMGVTFFLKASTLGWALPEEWNLFWIIGLAVGISLIPLSRALRTLIRPPNGEHNPEKAFTSYLVGWALLEGGMLINLVGLFVSSSYQFLPVVVVLAAIYLVSGPKAEDF